MPIRTAIVGLGTMGKLIFNGMLAHPDFDVKCVVDPNLPADFSAHYPHIIALESITALFERGDVDLVYLGTPPDCHLDYCHQILDHKLALWCEKPLATDLHAAQHFLHRVETENAVAAVNLSLASSGALSLLTDWMATKSLNKISHIEMNFHFSAWPRTWQKEASHWLDSPAQGGFLREIFSHFVFLHHRLIGKLELLNANIEYRDLQSSESSVVAQYVSNAIRVNVHGNVGESAPDKNEWILYGEQGSIKFSDWNTVSVADKSGWKNLAVIKESAVHNQLQQVKNMMQGKANTLATVREAYEVQKVVETTLLAG